MAEDMTFLPKNEVLSLEEIDRIASAFIRRGTRKLRLTGGEPLVRRGIIDLVVAVVTELMRPESFAPDTVGVSGYGNNQVIAVLTAVIIGYNHKDRMESD